ncbi:head GIN domain-containing protein [Bacteroidota bacterium]
MKTKLFKTVTAITFILLGLLFSNSYAGSLLEDKKETREVGDFNEIGLSIPANLYLTQGSKNEVVIEADEDLLEKIETEVNGTSLNIKFEKWYNYKGVGKINVYITVKEIKKLVVSGSGDIIAKSAINADKLAFIVSGSGSILIDDLTTQKVYAMITGSGDVRIEGSSKPNELDVTVTGSGDFESAKLEFKVADLNITGSGSIHTFVTEELEASITGSGKIYYKGSPLIDANITGSGRIKNDY